MIWRPADILCLFWDRRIGSLARSLHSNIKILRSSIQKRRSQAVRQWAMNCLTLLRSMCQGLEVYEISYLIWAMILGILSFHIYHNYETLSTYNINLLRTYVPLIKD